MALSFVSIILSLSLNLNTAKFKERNPPQQEIAKAKKRYQRRREKLLKDPTLTLIASN